MNATPDYIVTTGDYIAEWMEGEGITQAELARRLGTSRKHVSELLSGKAPLSHTLSLAMERVTGVAARIWNLYESGYRSDLARRTEDKALVAQYETAKAYPLTYLRKWGFIKASARDHADTVRGLLSILGVATLDALDDTWAHGAVAYRRSTVGRDDAPALRTWLALAERQHEVLRDLPAFDRARLESLIPRLRSLTLADPAEGVDEAINLLASVGIRLCFIPAVTGLRIYGATRWVNNHPIIQLSLFGKSDDQLWITLFHELGHVMLHGEKDLYLHVGTTKAEREANNFAHQTLLNPVAPSQLPATRDVTKIKSLAQQAGIAPSIVLNLTQRQTRDYKWGHELRHKFEFITQPELQLAT